MAEENSKRDIVVVDGSDRRPSYGWLITLIVIAFLVILFFVFGGFNLFNGSTGGTETINLETQVQPAN